MRIKYITNFLIFIILAFFIDKALLITKIFTTSNLIGIIVILTVYTVAMYIINKLIRRINGK